MKIPAAESQPRQRAFWWVWIGQSVSVIGSGLTSFALGVYIYQTTKSATAYTLIPAAMALAGIVVAPFAGVWVDRLSRRRMMVLADSGSALATLAMVGLLISGQLALWQVIVFTFASTALGTFQALAYSAMVGQVVPSDRLTRANGLIALSGAVSSVVAPVIAGVLIGWVGLVGVIAADLMTFVFAVLMVRRIPAESLPPPRVVPHEERHWRRELAEGWRFISAHRGLLTLLIFNTLINLIAVSEALITPLVLGFADERALGLVLGVVGLGLIAGTTLVSWRGGPHRLVVGVIGLEAVCGTSTLLMGLRPSVALVMFTAFTLFMMYPIIGSCNQTLWQRKTPQALYGRVGALRQMFSWSVLPLTFALAGPLADYVLTPWLSSDAALAGAVGQVIGEGQGRGIGLMMVVTGAVNVLMAAVAWSYGPLRRIESEMQDAVKNSA